MLDLTLKVLGKISAKVEQALQAQHSSKFKQLDRVSTVVMLDLTLKVLGKISAKVRQALQA